VGWSASHGGRIGGLHDLLLAWFGFGHLDEAGEEPSSVPVSEGEGQDVEEKIEAKKREGATADNRQAPWVPTERDRQRYLHDVNKVVEVMTSGRYLEHRPADLLASDIKITSPLLREGLSRGWLSAEDYFSATNKIWQSLFFTSEVEPAKGWLEVRAERDKPPGDFLARMSGAELSAALASWALGVPRRIESPQHALFALATAVSVARLPWLGDELEEIAKHLGRLLVLTPTEQSDEAFEDLTRRWRDVVRTGRALGNLERRLAGEGLEKIRHRLHWQKLAAGELLWQGARGFCLTLEPCNHVAGRHCPVRCLQAKATRMSFSVDYLVPLRHVLGTADSVGESGWGPTSGDLLSQLFDSVAEGFKGTLHP